MFDKIFDLITKSILLGVVITAVVLTLTTIIHAKQPQYLKDATITVTLKNGKTYSFTSKEYKVVARNLTPCPAPRVKLPKKFPPLKYARSRFTLYSGIGYNGVKLTSNSNIHTIEQKSAPVFGIGYSYKVFGNYSVGATALNNETYMINLGFDF